MTSPAAIWLAIESGRSLMISGIVLIQRGDVVFFCMMKCGGR
jgi:hypothetical protein